MRGGGKEIKTKRDTEYRKSSREREIEVLEMRQYNSKSTENTKSQTKCTQYKQLTHLHSLQGHSFIAYRYTYVNVLFKANCLKLQKMAINNNL